MELIDYPKYIKTQKGTTTQFAKTLIAISIVSYCFGDIQFPRLGKNIVEDKNEVWFDKLAIGGRADDAIDGINVDYESIEHRALTNLLTDVMCYYKPLRNDVICNNKKHLYYAYCTECSHYGYIHIGSYVDDYEFFFPTARERMSVEAWLKENLLNTTIDKKHIEEFFSIFGN